MTRHAWLLLVAAVATLAGPLVGDGLAKRPRPPKPRFVAMVNGKRFKGVGSILALYASGSFSINASARPRRHVVRSVTANCGPVDIKAVALPVTLTGCYGSYTEAGSRKLPFRQWTGTGIDVTVQSFDGTRITGSFRGTLALPPVAGDPPATIEGGTFLIALTDTGV